MKTVILFLIVAAGLSSCCAYHDFSSPTIKMDDINLGMDMKSIIEKYGHPYSFNKYSIGKDTVMTISYKTPQPIANCEFIVTTDLVFTNRKLDRISQSNFFVPENVFVCDSSKVRLNEHLYLRID